ncbi:hypothetical protein A2311_04735 [candidate division WOR-1 bacterium RIFOXYB2_FULL_48_7]|uniref:Uncharacterized protein n=1 Tax=candidate division WOR-1 bacterium RIFOXYB2_FULL_48_7 TaxID=1802583 RepID=A0A1F4TRX3_UNCSA|nr:MAG: hypothetical protein A2311_04735 [candidate division WOR-1 bacterium RIFOXYB2_FULL_48_7]
MKLQDKINDRKVAYLFRHHPAIAFELALLYYIKGKRKNSREKILEACRKSIYWLKKAEVELPADLPRMSCFGQQEEIEKILVSNKAKIDARLATFAVAFGLA